MNITFIEIDENGLDMIRPLWEKLRNHHRAVSRDFTKRYEEMSFDKRKDDLIKKAKNGRIRVDTAMDDISGQFIGYCITSLFYENGEIAGEIDSIYVEKDFRSKGIGDALLRRADKWMDNGGATVRKTVVAAGNEDVFSFYGRHGYCPKSILLEKVRN